MISIFFRFVLGGILLGLIASPICLASPTNIKNVEGERIPGKVIRMVGNDVVLDQDGAETTIAFDTLHHESKVAVLQWALPLIVGNEHFCKVRTILTKQDEPRGYYYNCTLENNSPMTLPKGLELDYNLYLLYFRGVNVNEAKGYRLEGGDKYYFKLGSVDVINFKTDFEELEPGQTYSFKTPTKIRATESWTPWADLDPNIEHTHERDAFGPHGTSDHLREWTQRMRSRVNANKYVLELQFQLDGETVYSYLNEPNAAPHVNGLWEEPISEYNPAAENEQPNDAWGPGDKDLADHPEAKEQERRAPEEGGLHAETPGEDRGKIEINSQPDTPAPIPSELVLKNGDTLPVTIEKVVGPDIHYFHMETGELELVTFSQLAESSKREVFRWLLEDLLERRLLEIQTKYESIKSIGNDREMGEYHVVVHNNSEATLPESMQVRTRIYRLGFTLEKAGDQFYYKLSSFNDRSGPSHQGYIPSKDKITLTTKRQVVNQPPYNWIRLAGGTFELNGQPASSDIYICAVKTSLVYEGKEYFSDISPSRARPFILDKEQWTKEDAPSKPLAELHRKPKINEEDTPDNESETKKVALPTSEPPKISYNSIVIIEGNEGVGSGFLLELKERKFLVTNSHVITGASRLTAKTTNGDEIDLPHYFFVARDRDLALFPINHNGDFLEPLEDYEEVDIGEAVTVYGNEAGASVVTELTGAVNGVGPLRVEIDAPFVEGNSGSPVIHHDTGSVIGLATYYIEYDKPEADREPGEYFNKRESLKQRRRFAERIDNAEQWDKVTLKMLQREAEELAAYEEYLRGVFMIADGVVSGSRIIRPSGATTEVNYLLEDYHRRRERGEVGSGGENRALEKLKGNIITGLDARHKEAERKIHSYYLKQEMEFNKQLSDMLKEYVSGLYYR